jgi:hypothetical protein
MTMPFLARVVFRVVSGKHMDIFNKGSGFDASLRRRGSASPTLLRKQMLQYLHQRAVAAHKVNGVRLIFGRMRKA